MNEGRTSFTIPACYAPAYYAKTPTASMRKLPLVAKAVAEEGLVTLLEPGPIPLAELRKLHDPSYVREFITGEGERATSQGWNWTPEIRNGVLAMQAGQLRAATQAFEYGIAANIAQGFHHAEYEQGGGFCTFNGLALVAQEHPDKKIFVLDCDEHQGNGTHEFTERLPNLYNFTIFGSLFGARDSERAHSRELAPVTHSFSKYTDALEEAYTHIRKWNPDLVIYQAGADPHIDDPLGTLGMTTDQLQKRDEHVFSFCHATKMPVLFVLAGGYQTPLDEKLVPLHVNTFRAAHKIYTADKSASMK